MFLGRVIGGFDREWNIVWEGFVSFLCTPATCGPCVSFVVVSQLSPRQY